MTPRLAGQHLLIRVDGDREIKNLMEIYATR